MLEVVKTGYQGKLNPFSLEEKDFNKKILADQKALDGKEDDAEVLMRNFS